MESLKETIKKRHEDLKKSLSLSNDMAVPKLKKVVINSGIGSISDKKKRELVFDRISKISGQKPIWTKAKKSIANFKLREGEDIGVKVTLRGDIMHQFIDKLINIAIPRMRDFHGIEPKSIDEMGNITLGIKEHTIFPETSDEDLKDVFGLSITINTTAKNKESALLFLKSINFPLKNEEEMDN